MAKSKQQELKDILWRLDNYAEGHAATISRLTGEAWKEAVEHGDWKKHLVEAHNLARELEQRLWAVIDQTECLSIHRRDAE
jgi:hypothetical protein